eukprot:6213147-Pleurochrysis_carterae.AAC.6
MDRYEARAKRLGTRDQDELSRKDRDVDNEGEERGSLGRKGERGAQRGEEKAALQACARVRVEHDVEVRMGGRKASH